MNTQNLQFSLETFKNMKNMKNLMHNVHLVFHFPRMTLSYLTTADEMENCVVLCVLTSSSAKIKFHNFFLIKEG